MPCCVAPRWPGRRRRIASWRRRSAAAPIGSICCAPRSARVHLRQASRVLPRVRLAVLSLRSTEVPMARLLSLAMCLAASVVSTTAFVAHADRTPIGRSVRPDQHDQHDQPEQTRQTAHAAAVAAVSAEARLRGERFERAVSAMQRVLRVWLTHADERTLLLPDRLPGPGSGLKPGERTRLYTPHNSGADLYPYLILTAELTDPDLYHGRMMEMLRNEVRFTNVEASIPGNLSLKTGVLGPASMFGAGEYAKDGLLTVTEYLGRTPWYTRMVD